MRIFFRSILFGLPLLIIGLHTFIPHTHEDHLSREEHQLIHLEKNSLLDILKLLFHQSQDEALDHLVLDDKEGTVKETVLPAYQINDNPFCSSSIILRELLIDKIFFLASSDDNDLALIRSGKLRGPPSVA